MASRAQVSVWASLIASAASDLPLERPPLLVLLPSRLQRGERLLQALERRILPARVHVHERARPTSASGVKLHCRRLSIQKKLAESSAEFETLF